MDLRLNGSTALVTGASRGIGFAAARLLAQEGCALAVTARDGQSLRNSAQSIARETIATVQAIDGDTSKRGVAERIVDDAIRSLGHIDILVVSTGSSEGGRIDSVADEHWVASLESKLMGHVRTCRAVLPHMIERGAGSIVLIVGNAGLKPSPWEVIPGAANAAIISFASSIAEQFAPQGIRVNTVNPGPVATDRWEGTVTAFAAETDVSLEEARSTLLSSLPIGRPSRADEVAPIVALLASPISSSITGAHIPVDGGQRKALMGVHAS